MMKLSGLRDKIISLALANLDLITKDSFCYSFLGIDVEHYNDSAPGHRVCYDGWVLFSGTLAEEVHKEIEFALEMRDGKMRAITNYRDSANKLIRFLENQNI